MCTRAHNGIDVLSVLDGAHGIDAALGEEREHCANNLKGDFESWLPAISGH